MSFVVLNCQLVEWLDIFANPVFKNPGIYIYILPNDGYECPKVLLIVD